MTSEASMVFELMNEIRNLTDEEWQRLQERAEDLRRMDSIHRFCAEQCAKIGPARDTHACDPDCALSPHKPPVSFGVAG